MGGAIADDGCYKILSIRLAIADYAFQLPLTLSAAITPRHWVKIRHDYYRQLLIIAIRFIIYIYMAMFSAITAAIRRADIIADIFDA